MSSPVHPFTAAIRAGLAAQRDEENAKAMQAYAKSKLPFYGIKAKPQKENFRNVNKQYPIKSFEEYELVIRELWDASYREEWYAACMLAERYKKYIIMDALPLYRMMIETGAWWDLVDGIAAYLIGGLLEKNREEMTKILYQWIEDDHLWIRRSAILAQLKFKENTDWTMLREFCEKCLHEDTFWMRKAIGWSLRQYSKSNPDAVREFVDKHRENMATVTLKEAVKYI